MEKMLKQGFTLVLSGEFGNISGGYLKKGNNGMVPSALKGIEVEELKEFPTLLESLQDNKILQLYTSCNDCVALIGSRCYEGPYAELEYLQVLKYACKDSVFEALKDLDLELSKNEEKVMTYKKAYKLYGGDKYKLEEEF